MIPDSGGTFTLPRLIGLQRASALMMLGEKVSAEQAAQMGMIYKVVADDELITLALQTASTLAALPTKGLGLTKRLLNQSANNNLEEQLHQEQIEQAEAGRSHDYKEGVNAFLEKRKPNFIGK